MVTRIIRGKPNPARGSRGRGTARAGFLAPGYPKAGQFHPSQVSQTVRIDGEGDNLASVPVEIVQMYSEDSVKTVYLKRRAEGHRSVVHFSFPLPCAAILPLQVQSILRSVREDFMHLYNFYCTTFAKHRGSQNRRTPKIGREACWVNGEPQRKRSDAGERSSPPKWPVCIRAGC
jgi:hypothetical protein